FHRAARQAHAGLRHWPLRLRKESLVADQHTVRAYDKDLDLLERRIAEMGGLAEKMVIDAVDALAAGDTALAQQVVETDPRLDTRQGEIEEQAIQTIARR